MKYRNIANPIWANEDQTMIDCTVEFKFQHGWEEVRFTAKENDIYKHVEDIYADCVDMGVGAYVAPLIENEA